jgi:alkyl hydroperoxide reductase subunit AhpC
MYNKFKASGFNIIGVSIDKRTEDWKQAIREDKTTWTHVVDKIDKAFQNCFDIQSVPSYMLLDEEGRIIAFHSSHSIIETFGPGIKRDKLEKTLLRLINRK